MTSFWHPFADMGAVENEALSIVRGRGVWVEDAGGRSYLDATASLWCANAGHGREEIAAAISAQLAELDTYSCFGDFTNPQAERLCDRLAGYAADPGSKVFLGSGGGDMVETAAKLARAYFVQTGEPGRQHIIGRTNAYHGTHGFGTSVGGIEANQTGFGRLIPDSSQVPFDSADALVAEIERVGPEQVAAFICEPVIGAGGVYLPPHGYLERVAEICRQYGVLLVSDSVIAGFGRLGTWLGIDRWGVAADMVLLAKGITSGVLPLGAVIVSGRVAEPFFTGAPGAPLLRHGVTYAGHPVCCAAANATLDVYEGEGLIGRARELEGVLEAALRAAERFGQVAEVRAGVGLIGAVELSSDLLASDPGAPLKLALACRTRGVLVRPLGRAVAVSPPLTIDHEQIALIGKAITDSLQELQ